MFNKYLNLHIIGNIKRNNLNVDAKQHKNNYSSFPSKANSYLIKILNKHSTIAMLRTEGKSQNYQ